MQLGWKDSVAHTDEDGGAVGADTDLPSPYEVIDVIIGGSLSPYLHEVAELCRTCIPACCPSLSSLPYGGPIIYFPPVNSASRLSWVAANWLYYTPVYHLSFLFI